MKTGDRNLLIMPFFHIYGMCALNAALYTGTTIIPLDAFQPDLFLKTIQNYKVKLLILVPTLVNFFVNSPLVERYDLSSLKSVICGGNCLSEEDARLFQNRYILFFFFEDFVSN